MAALSLYILTFNCAKSLIDIDAFASQLFNGLSQPKLPDIIVLSLQELAPLSQSLIGGSFLVPYFSRFHKAVDKASSKLSDNGAGPVYTSIVTRNVGMVGIMVFAKDPTTIQDLETGEIGTGASEMGNKGAAGIRFTYQKDSSSAELTFVAAHLQAFEDQVERRNADWKSIVRGMVFSSSTQNRGNARLSNEERPLLSISPQDASIYKSTSHLFVAGDLNYRTSTISPSSTDHEDTFPQPHHDKSSPRHFSILYESDQLNQERIAGRTLHGLIEAPVTFPPTYKYDPKEPPYLTPDEDLTTWHWAKHRWPSWTDRILYLDIPSWIKAKNPKAKIVAHKYSPLPLFPTSDHRAVALDLSIPLISWEKPDEEEASDDPRVNPPFDINIDWKSKREKARRLELMTGFTMYFTTTAEGVGVVVALLAGVVGACFAVKALLL